MTLSLFISSLLSALPSLFNIESCVHLSSQALNYTLNFLSPLSLYSWGKSNSAYYVFTTGSRRILRKRVQSGRLQFMITYLNWAQHCLEVCHISLESFAFQILQVSFQIFVSLLKPSCILSFLSTLFRENRNHLMKRPQLPANKSSNQLAFVPTVPTSFLLLFNEGVPPHSKGHPFLYLHPTPTCLLRKLSSSVLSHSSQFSSPFFSPLLAQCPVFHFFTSHLLCDSTNLPSPATPLHSSPHPRNLLDKVSSTPTCYIPRKLFCHDFI